MSDKKPKFGGIYEFPLPPGYTFNIIHDEIIMNTKIHRPLRPGDHVQQVCGHGTFKAQVIRTQKDGRIRIQYDDQKLIPPKASIPLEELEWSEDSLSQAFWNRDPRDYCPGCGDVWKKTHGLHLEVWYDCFKCGFKREDFLSEEDDL